MILSRFESCDSMTSYVFQVVETAQNLKKTGFEITDEWIESLLLAELPNKFSPIILATKHSKIVISVDVIKTKLRDISPEVGTTGKDSAFWSKQQSKSCNTNRSAKSQKLTSMLSNDMSTGSTHIKCYNFKKKRLL